MKRFTDTEKWSDPWYRKLSSPAKQLWQYLCDHCNTVGIVEVDYTLASMDCGQEIQQKHLVELGDRVELHSDGKLLIPKFIHFQYGELSEACPPHRSILKIVQRYGLVRVGLLYHYPKPTLALPSTKGSLTLQEKEKEKEKEKEDQERGGVGETSPLSGHQRKASRDDVVAFCVSPAVGLTESDGDWFFHRCEGSGWKNDGKPIRSWKSTIQAWRLQGSIFPSHRRADPTPNSSHEGVSASMQARLDSDHLSRLEVKIKEINSHQEGGNTLSKEDFDMRKELMIEAAILKKKLNFKV